MMNWITRKFKWRSKPPRNEALVRFLELNWDLFGNDKGQEYLYYLKQQIQYDLNPDKIHTDPNWAKAHEGMKDCVRLIESSLDKYNNNKVKENENASKKAS
jgi:hypothetical protein